MAKGRGFPCQIPMIRLTEKQAKWFFYGLATLNATSLVLGAINLLGLDGRHWALGTTEAALYAMVLSTNLVSLVWQVGVIVTRWRQRDETLF
jgi:hypothetical protein